MLLGVPGFDPSPNVSPLTCRPAPGMLGMKMFECMNPIQGTTDTCHLFFSRGGPESSKQPSWHRKLSRTPLLNEIPLPLASPLASNRRPGSLPRTGPPPPLQTQASLKTAEEHRRSTRRSTHHARPLRQAILPLLQGTYLLEAEELAPHRNDLFKAKNHVAPGLMTMWHPQVDRRREWYLDDLFHLVSRCIHCISL